MPSPVLLLEQRLDALRILETTFQRPDGRATHFLLTYTPKSIPVALEEYQLTLKQVLELFHLCFEVLEIAKMKEGGER